MDVFCRMRPAIWSLGGQHHDYGIDGNQANFKWCLFGLAVTTDSPHLVALSVSCGVASVTLLSGSVRALICKVFRKIAALLAEHSRPPFDIARMDQIHPRLVTSIQLQTSQDAAGDILVSLENIKICRSSNKVRLAQRISIGCGTECRTTVDRGSSPCFVPDMMADSVSDDLMIFEDPGDLQNNSLLGFSTSDSVRHDYENSELHQKFASIQTVLEGFNEEMREIDRAVCDLSARSRSSYDLPPPLSDKSSAHSALHSPSLMWEDEFDATTSVSQKVDLRSRVFSNLADPAKKDVDSKSIAIQAPSWMNTPHSVRKCGSGDLDVTYGTSQAGESKFSSRTRRPSSSPVKFSQEKSTDLSLENRVSSSCSSVISADRVAKHRRREL